MILHHFQTSCSSDNALKAALPLIDKDDVVLMSSEALYGLLDVTVTTHLADFKVCVLAQDAEALGLTTKLAHFCLLDYAEFVQLTLDVDKVISW